MSNPRYRMVVKRRHVRHRQFQVLVLALAAALIMGLGFVLGQAAAFSGIGLDPERYRVMELLLPEAQRQSAELETQRDVLLARHEIDRNALEIVRREIAAEKEQISELEEGLRFYRSLMAPGEIAQGLSLRGIELVAHESDSKIDYRLVAQQEARKHSLLKGSVRITVLGLQGEQRVSYPLSKLDSDLDGDTVELRFRYFQAIEGEITIPEGFEPLSISVVATASSPRKTEVRESYPWQVQEKFTHVGK